MKSNELKEKNLKEYIENPEKKLNSLLKNMILDKLYVYQRKAYEFYGKKCSICVEMEGQIDVHHKDKNRKNNTIENLQVLCASCHAKIHKQVSNNI